MTTSPTYSPRDCPKCGLAGAAGVTHFCPLPTSEGLAPILPAPVIAPDLMRPALPTRALYLAYVDAERDRQDAKWGGVPGVDRRDDPTYAAVLTEEVGEACQAWLQRDVQALRDELIQVAAVAVAWLEELENGGMVPRA